MRIEIDVLNEKSISKAISDLKVYKRELKSKMDELTMRAAEIGAEEVGREYSMVYPFDSTHGNPDFSIDIVPKEKGYAIQATGSDVLFLEFGAGATYGSTSADVDYSDSEGFVIEGADAPYGPGTFPNGKGHWNDPDGWYYDRGKKSKGNPPSAGMYYAKLEIVRNLEKLKEEIFNG